MPVLIKIKYCSVFTLFLIKLEHFCNISICYFCVTLYSDFFYLKFY